MPLYSLLWIQWHPLFRRVLWFFNSMWWVRVQINISFRFYGLTHNNFAFCLWKNGILKSYLMFVSDKKEVAVVCILLLLELGTISHSFRNYLYIHKHYQYFYLENRLRLWTSSQARLNSTNFYFLIKMKLVKSFASS